MGRTVRGIAAILASLAILGHNSPGIARAGAAALRLSHQGQAVRVLAPGASFLAVAAEPPAGHVPYCLGLASMRDRYGLPVSLGIFHPHGDGMIAVQATVPSAVFPAEPPGPFLLYVGRCTSVAPDGALASATVTIVPAAG